MNGDFIRGDEVHHKKSALSISYEPHRKKTGFLARLHEVQKSYCSHPGCTRSRSTLLKFSRSLYLDKQVSESIHTWSIGSFHCMTSDPRVYGGGGGGGLKI